MTKKNKVIVLFFALIVFLAFVFSFSFIVYESNHDCIGENCQICTIINSVNETLENISTAVAAFALTLALTYIGYKCIFCSDDVFSQSSPVLLKVKLLN